MKKNPEANKNSSMSIEDQKQSAVTSLSSKKEAAKTEDLEDEEELERREAYIEPKTRDLLRKLLQDGDEEEIVPVYNPSLGFVYKTNHSSLGENGNGKIPRDLLENLARLDILQESFFDAVSVCPSCSSTILTIHNRCPKCKSHNVDKTSLTEHIPCGFIDQREKYKDNRCPKCGQPLLEDQYRNMGRWYVCQECGERFEHPEFDLICHSCNKSFMIKEAGTLETPKFALNMQRKKEIRQNVASLEDFRTLLTSMGFSIQIPGLATGEKSGVQHHFSIIAKKQVSGQEVNIALDHAVSESEVSSSPLILYIYKTSEVKVDIPVFVAMPKLNETAKKIAQGHEILLIEGSLEEKGAVEKIKKDIEFRIEMKLIEAEVAKKKASMKPDNSSLRGKLSEFKKKMTT